MFHRWKRRVLKEGAQGEGQVYGLTSYANGMDFGVKVRVKLPDGSTAEFEKGPLETRDVGMLFVGSVVPVRYDPADPKKVVLDTPALEAAQAQVKEGQQAALDAQFEHLGEGATGAAAGGDIRSQILQMAASGQGGVIDLRGEGSTPEDRVAKLEALKEQGLIDDAQFAAAKAKILGD
jgi:hypothetical protein